NIVVRVETLPGVLHPVEGSGLPSTLEPIELGGGVVQVPGGDGGADSIVDLWNISDSQLLELLFKAEFQPMYLNQPAVIQQYYAKNLPHGKTVTLATRTIPPFMDVKVESKKIHLYLITSGSSSDCMKNVPGSILSKTDYIVLIGVVEVPTHEEGVDYLIADAIFYNSNDVELGRLSDYCSLGSPLVPHNDIQDPVTVYDPDGDGVAEIELTSLGAYHWGGMKDAGFAVISYLSTDNITLNETGKIGVIITFDAELRHYSGSPGNAWHAAYHEQPLIGITLYRISNGSLVVQDYRLRTYRDIGNEVGDPLHWWHADNISIVEVFYNVPPGSYKVSFTIIDAHPYNYLRTLIQRISVYLIP
ncbi:MAG: hypothetical protein GSR86_06655, partial [Desulfurococcales archaeon]|nr:hypothetical protein [Desulfurococcales archaeon]